MRPHHKIEVVTVKLSMLLALAFAGRSSHLRALYVRYTSVEDNSIAFELAQLIRSLGEEDRVPSNRISTSLRVILCRVFSQPLSVI